MPSVLMKNMMPLEASELTMTPASSALLENSGGSLPAISQTTASASNAPPSAAAGSAQTIVNVSPLQTAATAASPAPPDTPRTNGSASGLRNTAW